MHSKRDGKKLVSYNPKGAYNLNWNIRETVGGVRCSTKQDSHISEPLKVPLCPDTRTKYSSDQVVPICLLPLPSNEQSIWTDNRNCWAWYSHLPEQWTSMSLILQKRHMPLVWENTDVAVNSRQVWFIKNSLLALTDVSLNHSGSEGERGNYWALVMCGLCFKK